MSAEILRRAAALMQERAGAATPGPWESGTDGWTETVSGDGEDWCFVRRVGSASDITEHMLHGQPEIDSQTMADAEHIAAWDPAVALAVADWLDSLVDAMTNPNARYGGASTGREEASALAVARLYLGAAS